jgi:hypothetical protein
MNHQQTFISSFPMPANSDVTPPAFEKVPQTLSVQATGPSGAEVWYMLPTAIDPNGATVFCTPKPNAMLALGTHNILCSATDTNGNATTTTFSASVIDTRGPVIVTRDVTVPQTGPLTTVSYTAPTATDQVSGNTAVSCSPSSPSAFPAGHSTVNCFSLDALGNRTDENFDIYVTMQFGGILQPINADGSSVFKLGSTVPVKFTLAGVSANVTDAVARLSLVKLSNNPLGTVQEAVSNGQADTGNLFRYSGGQNVFNLSTKGLTAGGYQLRIDTNDGAIHTVNISLKP